MAGNDDDRDRDGRGHDRAGRDHDSERGGGFDNDGSKLESTGSPRRPKGAYPVGHGKPPAEYRVKPGQCLNPTGRPKGAKNKPKPASSGDVRAMILREARRQVTVSDAQGPVTMSMVEMVYRSLGLRAAKGSVRAGRDFVSLAREAEREEASERTSVLLAIAEYKLEFERRRRALGKKPPGFILDPDGFIVGPKDLVGFRERASEEDKARWQGQRAECQQELKVAKAQLVGVKGRKRALLKREIETLGRVLAYIDEALAGSRDAMWILDQGTVFDRDDET